MKRAGLLLVLFVAPTALAHGSGPESTFDPLVVEMPLYLHPDARLRAEVPAPREIAFPPYDPLTPSVGLAFDVAAPVRFLAGGGVAVDLLLRARELHLSQDANGDGLELVLLHDGEPINGSARRVVLSPFLGAGNDVRATVTLQAPGVTFDKGARVGILARPLMPSLREGALTLAMGEGASTARFASMRVPEIVDLELQESPLVEFLLSRETYAPANATALAVRVTHTEVGLDARSVAAQRVTLVFRGEDAHAHADTHATPYREERIARAHVFRVDGALVRVHPGVGVAVPLEAGPRNATIECVQNCPEGWSAVVRIGEGPPPERPAPSRGTGLIPPPRSTDGVPVSQDAPPERAATPVPILATLAALLVAARLRAGR